MKSCKKCSLRFEISEKDSIFYDKISVPEPTLCPPCRNQRRMAFRNERHLYQRKCDKCSASMLSIYEQDTAFPVYCYECWWGDEWDGLEFGQDYQPNTPFFDQLDELWERVPHLGIVTGHCENSDYNNYTNYSKDCYLLFGCHGDEECYYGWRVHNSLGCVDCLQVDKSKYCYECIDCDECYSLFFSQDCNNCSDSAFLYDCKGCQNCLFSAGLRNKSYCIRNQQYSKQEYLVEKKKLDLASHATCVFAKKKFDEFLLGHTRRATFVVNAENVSGDHIVNCKDVLHSFNVRDCQDGNYLESCEHLKDALDSTFTGWPSQLNYEGISGGCVNSYNCKFVDTCWSVSDIEYCSSCHHSKQLFGCFGLRHKNEFCILNKQYSKEEYEVLRAKIIDEMRSRREYGEFFPSRLSPFAYNETVANDFYPLSKDQAQKQRFTWKDDDPKNSQSQTCNLADNIGEVSESLTQEVLACETCKRNYKIIAQELLFYKRMGLPVPRDCFNCRHTKRMASRNGNQLFERVCSSCSASIQTTYSDDRPEKVCCKKCYLEGVY